jgi:hypothetical protein
MPDPLSVSFNVGSPDGLIWESKCGKTATVDLGEDPSKWLVADGDKGAYDLVYYENWIGTGIYLDRVTIRLCKDAACKVAVEVFNWGDGEPDLNSNVKDHANGIPKEDHNTLIPAASLYGTGMLNGMLVKSGVAIDIDIPGVESGRYRFVSFSSTMTDSTQVPEIDAIEVLPTMGPNPPPPEVIGGGGMGAGGAAGGAGGAAGGAGGAAGGAGGAAGGAGGAAGGAGGGL